MLPRLPRNALLLLSLAVLWNTASLVRADKEPVPRGPSREPEPYRYDPKAWQKVPKAFLEDSPACILYSGTSYLIEADGTVETITHEITRLNGRKGIDKLGEYRSITYDPAYEKVTLNEARVHKPNGKVIGVLPKHLQLRDMGTDYQVYDPDKQLIISFPNLEVGDVIEVRWTTRGKNPEFAGHFFTRYTFGDDRYPVVRDELRVRLPKAKTLKFATVNGKVEERIKDMDQERYYHWAASNRPPLPLDENLPSREELRLQLSFSTFSSWEEVGKWKQKLRADCWKCTPEIEKVVKEVTKDLKTNLEKARALAYWVRRRIRYLSVGSVRHAYTPHLPADVLAWLFGDCKDQAQLLAVMLRAAGIPVSLVTLGILDDGQVLEEVPSPWGTHAILLVTLDGQDHWIDTTLTNAPWDFLPRDDRGRLAYVTDEKGLRLLRTPSMTYQDTRYEQVTELSIQPDGTSRCRRKQTFHGSAALAKRNAWTEVPAGERRRLMTSELQDAYSKARLRRLLINDKNLSNLDQPVSAVVEFDIPGHFSGESDKEGSFTDSKVWGRLLSYSVDLDRSVPLDLGTPFESIHRYIVQVPPAYRLDSFPKAQLVKSKWGFFRLNVKPDPKNMRRLELEFHTRLEKTRVAPADFAAFAKFHEDVNKSWRAWITMKPTQELADAPALEALVTFAPGDVASATILARLYYQNDQLKDARRVLRWARLFHANDPVLWELTVKSSADFAEEEAAYQEMVKRFPGEMKYRVALGATRVKRSNYTGAKEVLEPLTKDDSAVIRAAAHYQLARSNAAQKQAAAALEHFKAAEEDDPDSVNTVLALQFKAQLHEQLSQTKQAGDAYRQALKLDADNEEVLAALIRLHIAAKDSSEAVNYLRRFAVVAGNDVNRLVQAADFQLQLGRFEEAFDLASRARDQKFHAGSQRILGLIHLHRGEYEKAVFHLDRADREADVLEGLMRGYLALGKLAKAEEPLEAAKTLAEKTPGLEQAKGLVHALVERRAAMLKELRVPLEKAGTWSGAIDAYLCAEQARARGRPAAEVEKLLAAAFTEDVEIGPAFGLRGLLALEKGRLTKALADAEKAAKLSPDLGWGFYVRGRVRLERGQKGALSDLVKAAKLTERKDGMVLHWLATAFFQAGKRDEALTVQRVAAILRPNDPEVLEQLREFEKAGKKEKGKEFEPQRHQEL
jgi:tetratricopeptide (TPR) repeat protein